MKIRILLAIFVALLSIILSACKPTTPEQEFKGMTSVQIFQGAEKALAKGEYDKATKYFEGLQALYPFGPEAEQAQLDIIYAYYKNNDYASAIGAADRYIHLYPQNDHVDYAYYMKGVVNFERGRSWIQRKFKVSPAEIDTTYLQQAFVNFNELLQRFPNSRFAPDSQRRMVYIRNMLAKNELNIAQFYFRHGAYVAAINRANNVVKHYESSPQVISALVLIVKADRALNLNKEADEALRILRLNYPNTRQLKKL